MSRTIMKQFVFLIASGCLCLVIRLSIAQNPTAPENARLHLRVNTHCVTTGSGIRIREAGQNRFGIRARSISHVVERVGVYHRELNQILFYDSAALGLDAPESAFHNLPIGRVSTGPMSFDFTNRVESGYEFSIKANRAGAYLISAVWTDAKTGKSITSNRALVIVQPALDMNGVPIDDPNAYSEETPDAQAGIEEIATDADGFPTFRVDGISCYSGKPK